MKVIYVGHAKDIHVTVPIGAVKKLQTGTIKFTKGVPTEIDDLDGEKLIALDKHNHFVKEMAEPEAKVEAKEEEEPTEALAEEEPEEKKASKPRAKHKK